MTPEEKQEIIDEVIPEVLQALFAGSSSALLDITGLNSAQSLDGISTFPAIQSVNGNLALVSVPISLLTQAINNVIQDARTATANAASAAAGWAIAVDKMNGQFVVIEGNVETLQNADKSLSALTSYAECTTAANVPSKAVTIEDFVLPTNGGCLHIKMTNANTSASGVTLNINSTGAKALYYNGSAVSATNTWEDNEVLEIYYDGTNSIYQASNARGDGGRADKISFDNTIKGVYDSENVQDVIDDITADIAGHAVAINNLSQTTIPTIQGDIGDIGEELDDIDEEIDAITSVYNVTKNHPLQSGYYTLTTALAAVPSAKRSIGLIITYQTSAGWEAKQFIGSNVSGWSTTTNWTDFGSGGDDFVPVTSAEVAAMDDPI